MAQSNLNQSFNVGGSHSRSLSQPTFFANTCLPPLSPLPPTESPLASANSNFKDLSMEEIDVSSRVPPIPPSFPRDNLFRANDSLPPRKGHRRSNSDVPLGFSAMIQSSPQLVPISGQGILGKPTNMTGNDKRQEMDKVNYGNNGVEGKSEGEVVDEMFNSLMNLENVDKDNIISGIKMNNGEIIREGLKRSAAGDIAPPARHYRSMSMDSGFEKFHFSDESQKLQTSPSNSLSDNLAQINLDFGHGEFNQFELKKIMEDERLAEIAVSDPKRAKRILANRQSAARSKERKMRYISELEHKVHTLQTEATTLSAQITITQKNYAELTNENNELKIRFQAMEQQSQLRDALHDALSAEVQRLKLANMELKEDARTSGGIAHNGLMKHHMFPIQRQQPNQMQRLSLGASTTSTTS
ncbi:hypothetical protein ACJIZ3_024835 [Penstemon smallii]|uniref:BZIP domain-containing protein n=1 Tax=Penstemon smallii TaxID=265156 RepID=A0ABD3TT18_9LAMI